MTDGTIRHLVQLPIRHRQRTRRSETKTAWRKTRLNCTLSIVISCHFLQDPGRARLDWDVEEREHSSMVQDLGHIAQFRQYMGRIRHAQSQEETGRQHVQHLPDIVPDQGPGGGRD